MTNKHARELGRLGGIARATKYPKEKLREWGKKGGRPKNMTLSQLVTERMENEKSIRN